MTSFDRSERMVLAARLLVRVASVWCVFWWGHAFGMRTASDSELSQATADAEISRAIRSQCSQTCAMVVVDSLDGLRSNRIKLLEQSRPSAADLFLAPLTSPVSAFALSSVRSGSISE